MSPKAESTGERGQAVGGVADEKDAPANIPGDIGTEVSGSDEPTAPSSGAPLVFTSKYLSDQEDVVGYVALALHLLSLTDPDSKSTLDNIEKTSSGNATVGFAYRSAADRIVTAYCKDRVLIDEKIDKSTDPLFLLLKEEFRDHANSINEEFAEASNNIGSILSQLSLRHQVVTAAAAGLVVSIFIILASFLSETAADITKHWSHIANGGK